MEYQKITKVSKNSQSQRRMIKKYLKKDTYLQKKIKDY